MLSKNTLDIADEWWARDFACGPGDLRPAATRVQLHAGKSTGSDGIWILAVGACPLVSLPPSLFERLGERARSWSRATIESPTALAAALAPVPIARIVGPASIAYATRECGADARARALDEGDRDRVADLRSRCTAEEWEHGGSDFGSVPTFGAFDERGELMALAGYQRWDRIAHLYIVTSPAARGRGYGGAAVSAAASHASSAGLLPQYRTLRANVPAIRLARRLGFAEYGVSVFVRIRAAE